MKVLQLTATKGGLYSKSGSPNGGLETVVLNLHEAFTEVGWSSFFSDSVASKSDAEIKYDLEAGYETYAETIHSWIVKEKPDLVIAHGTNALLRHLTRLGIRVLFVEHSMAISINLNGYGPLFSTFAPEARAIGSKIITVSPITMKTKKEAIQELGIDFDFDGWCRFQFPTRELLDRPIEPSDGYCITIARCEKKKSIERMINQCIRFGFDWRVVTSIPNEQSKALFDKELSRYDQSKMFVNVGRATTLDILSRGAILGSSGPFESAGVTAFEGLMFGLPLLLNEPPSQDGIHASRMFLPDDTFVSTLRSPKERTEKLMHLTLKERKELRDLVVAHNGVADVLANIERYAAEIGSPRGERQSSSLEALLM